MKGLRAWTEGRDLSSKVCGASSKGRSSLGSCGALLVRSFHEAIEELTQKLGSDMRVWEWGHLHRMHFKNTFSQTPLKPFFHKSYPSAGSRRSLDIALYYSAAESGFDALHSANQRFIVELGPNDKSSKDSPPTYWMMDMVSVSLTQGNSGIKGSPYYEDLMVDHNEGKYRLARFGTSS